MNRWERMGGNGDKPKPLGQVPGLSCPWCTFGEPHPEGAPKCRLVDPRNLRERVIELAPLVAWCAVYLGRIARRVQSQEEPPDA